MDKVNIEFHKVDGPRYLILNYAGRIVGYDYSLGGAERKAEDLGAEIACLAEHVSVSVSKASLVAA